MAAKVTKAVKAAAETALVEQAQAAVATVAEVIADAITNQVRKTVYSFVHTYGQDGKITDTRVIDMSDNGARKWLLNHHWWSLTNGHMIGLVAATKVDHDKFQLERLASKFNKAS